ncbi:MAG: hypothetical protein JWQ18_795 [Conexibacter sp.]|nr:hypothetical protein [Conexibacter sp.]
MGMRLFALAILAVLVVPRAASAAFEAPPVEIGQGSYRVGVAAATDFAGATTAVLSGVGGGTRIVRRPSAAGPWAPSEKLPGRELGVVAGPVVAAAGAGALALAWRIDTPKRYSAIAALAADPGSGVLGAPVVVSPADAGGVRHPAVAVDGAGRAVLVYNTGTRAIHLSLRGGIAISLRAPGGAFGAPVIVDPTPSSRPAVALAPDGRGIVAWTHDRRVWAVSVDTVAGTVGKVVALTGAAAHLSVVATAGPDGGATVAWVTHRSVGKGSARRTFTELQAAHRAGGAAAFPKKLLSIGPPGGRRAYIPTIVAAADERGTATVAWTQRMFVPDRSVGINGVTDSVQAATIGNGRGRFGATLVLRPEGAVDCETPSVAARAGVAVVAWACNDHRSETVSTRSTAPGATATPVLNYKLNARAASQPTPLVVGLDGTGTSTILAVTVDVPDPTQPQVSHVLATTGR